MGPGVESRAVTPILLGLLAALPCIGHADELCPAAKSLPQLNIDTIENPAVPVVDNWQIFLGDVPMSDAQLALMSKDDTAIDLTRVEMESRGTWVYIGMLTAAAGAALSCAGWLLFGQQGKIPDAVALPMALGGLVVGGGGVLLVTESIQTPLEPHLAPTPRHRLSREEARRLVAVVNKRLFEDICKAADEVDPNSLAPLAPAPPKP